MSHSHAFLGHDMYVTYINSSLVWIAELITALYLYNYKGEFTVRLACLYDGVCM